ncbi:response regulator [Chryseolinea sp. T2]|uniref:response regulator n=1 Tax=Chryseolinea sp. T2 TaxID=3129255 RepID=UPI00307818CF
MLNIVIIDDDCEEIEFMKDAINTAFPGSKCEAFEDCEKALVALINSSPPPDYIFVDVNMVKMSGEECVMAIRGIDHLRNTKIVLMSSSMHIYESKQKRFIDLGASGITEKPDSMDEYGTMFIDAIRSVKEQLE